MKKENLNPAAKNDSPITQAKAGVKQEDMREKAREQHTNHFTSRAPQEKK